MTSFCHLNVLRVKYLKVQQDLGMKILQMVCESTLFYSDAAVAYWLTLCKYIRLNDTFLPARVAAISNIMEGCEFWAHLPLTLTKL